MVKNWTHKVHDKSKLSKYLEIKVSLEILNDLKAQNFLWPGLLTTKTQLLKKNKSGHTN